MDADNNKSVGEVPVEGEQWRSGGEWTGGVCSDGYGFIEHFVVAVQVMVKIIVADKQLALLAQGHGRQLLLPQQPEVLPPDHSGQAGEGGAQRGGL